jgi:dephospho-CoA kinase
VENYDCKSFSIFGNPRLYSGRRSTKNYANAIDAIKETFGTTFWCCSKRDKLAEIVFSDSENCTTQCDCPSCR